MDNQERIRQLLLESQPAVDEDRGWAGVQIRAMRARRRNRGIQSLGAVLVVAVVIGAGIGLRSWWAASPDVAAPIETTSRSVADQSGSVWSAPDPPSTGASGLTIDSLPPGFAFQITELTGDLARSSVFHRFASSDGTEFSIGRHRQGLPLSGEGVVVTIDGREFTIAESPSQTRVMEEVAGGVRVDVVSHQLDTDALLEIVKGITYDPARDWAPTSIP